MVNRRRKQKMVRVISWGVFDLIHCGHIRSLKEAKKYGELTVGVFSDKVAKSFKRQPIIPEKQRLELIKELKCVDKAFILRKLVPDTKGYDIVVKGPGATFEKTKFPIKKILLKYHNINSTTEIIEKCNDYIQQLNRKNANSKICDYTSKSCLGGFKRGKRDIKK